MIIDWVQIVNMTRRMSSRVFQIPIQRNIIIIILIFNNGKKKLSTLIILHNVVSSLINLYLSATWMSMDLCLGVIVNY